MSNTHRAVLATVIASSIVVISLRATAEHKKTGSLWEHDNLVAWCVVPFDANHRGPEQRAQMLRQLGFKHFAYDWREKIFPPSMQKSRRSKNTGSICLPGGFLSMQMTRSPGRLLRYSNVTTSIHSCGSCSLKRDLLGRRMRSR